MTEDVEDFFEAKVVWSSSPPPPAVESCSHWQYPNVVECHRCGWSAKRESLEAAAALGEVAISYLREVLERFATSLGIPVENEYGESKNNDTLEREIAGKIDALEARVQSLLSAGAEVIAKAVEFQIAAHNLQNVDGGNLWIAATNLNAAIEAFKASAEDAR